MNSAPFCLIFFKNRCVVGWIKLNQRHSNRVSHMDKFFLKVLILTILKKVYSLVWAYCRLHHMLQSNGLTIFHFYFAVINENSKHHNTFLTKISTNPIMSCVHSTSFSICFKNQISPIYNNPRLCLDDKKINNKWLIFCQLTTCSCVWVVNKTNNNKRSVLWIK